MLYFFARELSRLVFILLGHLRIFGRENIPKTGGFIVAPNHTCYLDPPLTGCGSPRKIHFMAKAELFHNKYFGALITALGTFPVHRGTADREALRKAHELLLAENGLLIFIEGGTSKDNGRIQSPELGAAMIAARAGVPIIPCAIINADKMLPPGTKKLHRARLIVAFGEPVVIERPETGKPDRAALQHASETVMHRIAALMIEHGAPERVPEKYLE